MPSNQLNHYHKPMVFDINQFLNQGPYEILGGPHKQNTIVDIPQLTILVVNKKCLLEIYS